MAGRNRHLLPAQLVHVPAQADTGRHAVAVFIWGSVTPRRPDQQAPSSFIFLIR